MNTATPSASPLFRRVGLLGVCVGTPGRFYHHPRLALEIARKVALRVGEDPQGQLTVDWLPPGGGPVRLAEVIPQPLRPEDFLSQIGSAVK